MNSYVTIKNLKKAFENTNWVVNIDHLTIERNKIIAVIGESGSGKTTLMRLISGLEVPSEGQITINGTVINDATTYIPPEKRHIGFVFQDYALFPHLTVYENVVYGIPGTKNKKTTATDLLQLVGLSGYESRYPHQLSGGQQQRVALARALAPKPELLILDEPFSNLDTSLKRSLRNQIFSIIKKAQVTALFVTHDVADVIAIADEVIILDQGSLVQTGSIANLTTAPKTLGVATLFSTYIALPSALLQLFRFPYKEGVNYAIKQEDFIVNAPSKYSVTGGVIRSALKEDTYVNIIQFSDGQWINCITDHQLEGEISIGFTEDKLRQFTTNQ